MAKNKNLSKKFSITQDGNLIEKKIFYHAGMNIAVNLPDLNYLLKPTEIRKILNQEKYKG